MPGVESGHVPPMRITLPGVAIKQPRLVPIAARTAADEGGETHHRDESRENDEYPHDPPPCALPNRSTRPPCEDLDGGGSVAKRDGPTRSLPSLATDSRLGRRLDDVTDAFTAHLDLRD